MRIRDRIALLGVGFLVLLVALAWRPRLGGLAQPPAQLPAESVRRPVLVELFTSEGCSSCPPADALLARLGATQPVSGAQIIALKEHVDYWNHLGWRDPFSSAEVTARQDSYSQAFGNATVYTPQMVVDGEAEFIGSAEGEARRAVLAAARLPKATIRLEWPAAQARPSSMPLRVEIGPLENSSSSEAADVYLAITEDNLHSNVTRGENAGRRLDHFAVVRQLKRISQAQPRSRAVFVVEPVVTLSPEWKRQDLRAVVFVQESRSRRVLGVAAISVPAN